ncbi:Dyp-type peroxidase [Herbidospora sp. RD11066]
MADLTRRGLLTGGVVAGVVALTPAAAAGEAEAAKTIVPFHGPRQAGIATEPQAHAVFVAFDLRKDTDRDALGRMMRLLTDDARRLTQGRPALADTEPELAASPARLTVTFGFGPGLYAHAKTASPIGQLPRFSIDKLDKKWTGGDLLVQICADDPLTVTHALRMIVKDARSFATVRWTQRGFRRTSGGGTPRNVMGQLDGTANPKPGTPEFDLAVWRPDGTTQLVVRRIRAELETWDAADVVAREFTIGRRLSTGAPLTGTKEHDAPDFAATGAHGFPVISEYAHIRRAHAGDPSLRILRRVYNYDDDVTAQGHADSGLVFASYQADIERQFVPIQKRLAEADLLNEWITPIGSAVFAVPRGCDEKGWIGQEVLS